jgi:hypothetical protein
MEAQLLGGTMRIDLTPHELLICKTIGVMRRTAASNKVVDRQMGTQDPWDIDVDGMVGEFCVAKHLNVFPDLTVGIRSGGADLIKNGKNIDVKTTRYKNGHLLATLKKAEAPCDTYILVIVDDKGGDIVGWVSKGKLFVDENIKDKGHGDGYVMSQSQLNKEFPT